MNVIETINIYACKKRKVFQTSGLYAGASKTTIIHCVHISVFFFYIILYHLYIVFVKGRG